MKNYYKVLQVDPSAEPEIIEASFRRLMKKYHPDAAPSDEWALSQSNEKAREIIEAYETLSDEGRRKEYDAALRDRSLISTAAAFDNADDSLISIFVPFKCSVSKRTYRMEIVKSPEWKGPYVVKGFESVEEGGEQSTQGQRRGLRERWDALEIRLLALFLHEDLPDEQVCLGDISWVGVRCPDCGRTVEMRPGFYSSVSMCPRCHQIQCTGGLIKGIAGYSTVCAWCGQYSMLLGTARTSETSAEGGTPIKGVSPTKGVHEESKKPLLPGHAGTTPPDKKSE